MGKIAVANPRDRVPSPAVRLSDGWCRIQPIRTPVNAVAISGPVGEPVTVGLALPIASCGSSPPPGLRLFSEIGDRRQREDGASGACCPRVPVLESECPAGKSACSRRLKQVVGETSMAHRTFIRCGNPAGSGAILGAKAGRNESPPAQGTTMGFVARSRLLKLEPSRAREKLRAVQVSPSRSSWCVLYGNFSTRDQGISRDTGRPRPGSLAWLPCRSLPPKRYVNICPPMRPRGACGHCQELRAEWDQTGPGPTPPTPPTHPSRWATVFCRRGSGNHLRDNGS